VIFEGKRRTGGASKTGLVFALHLGVILEGKRRTGGA